MGSRCGSLVGKFSELLRCDSVIFQLKRMSELKYVSYSLFSIFNPHMNIRLFQIVSMFLYPMPHSFAIFCISKYHLAWVYLSFLLLPMISIVLLSLSIWYNSIFIRFSLCSCLILEYWIELNFHSGGKVNDFIK